MTPGAQADGAPSNQRSVTAARSMGMQLDRNAGQFPGIAATGIANSPGFVACSLFLALNPARFECVPERVEPKEKKMLSAGCADVPNDDSRLCRVDAAGGHWSLRVLALR